MTNKGYTLVEVIIVVGIIGLLAILALPNFFKARDVAKKNICIANMKQLQGGFELWALEEDKEMDDTPLVTDIVPDYVKKWPKCSGVSYETFSLGEGPSCPNDIQSHVLNVHND